jgi:hypothetical protein
MYTLYDEPSGIFHPNHPLHRFLPELLPFQQVKILHQTFIFMSVALSNVFPILFPPEPEELLGPEIIEIVQRVRQLDRTCESRSPLYVRASR